jgi:hypothetical protein
MRPHVRNTFAFLYAWSAIIWIDRDSFMEATKLFWRDPSFSTLTYDAGVFGMIAAVMTVAFLTGDP